MFENVEFGSGNAELKNQKDLKERTKKFALSVISLSVFLPHTREAEVIARQLIRSGTSVGANYREASRARSKAEFIAKIGIVEQEADETLYWLELLQESKIVNPERLIDLTKEADELVAIFATIGKKSKK